MLQKIKNVNLLQLAKDMKDIISEEKFQLITKDYEIEMEKSDNISDLNALLKLLSMMVKDNCLITEIYFESKEDFNKCFNMKYDDCLNEVFHSIRIKKIKFQDVEAYSGTFIYHETFGEKMKFQLTCIKYLSKFQKEEMCK